MSVSINYEIAGGGTGSSGSTGTAVGGGLATSSGSDITALTLVSGGDADGQPSEWTAGLPFEVVRDGNALPLSVDVVGSSPLISSTLTRVGTSNYYTVDDADPKFLSGALVLTLAQMRALETNANAAATTIEPGFRVFVTDVGSYTNPSNVTITPGAFAYWQGSEFWWESGVLYRNDYVTTHQNSASLSSALMSITIPATVMGSNGTAFTHYRIDYTAGGANTKAAYQYLNGSIFSQATGLAATILWSQGRKSLWNKGSASSQQSENLASFDTNTSSSTALQSLSINTNTTSLVFDVRVQFGGTSASDIANVQRHEVLVTNGFSLA